MNCMIHKPKPVGQSDLLEIEESAFSENIYHDSFALLKLLSL